VSFPVGFDVSTATCDTSLHALCTSSVSGQVVTLGKITLVGGSDSKIAVLGIKNPTTSGSYGPIGLTTRHFQTGQIVDINRVFATVGIEATPSGLLSATVDLDGTTPDRSTGKVGGEITAKFTLT
jgi:hypothetical protein